MDDAKRDRALHSLMREAESRRSQMRAALERLCDRAVPAPVSPDDVLKALVDILYGRGVPGIRRSHVGAAEGRRARAFRRWDEKEHPGSRPEWHGYAHREKAPEDQLMPDGTVKALVAALLDHLDAVGIPTVVSNDRIEGKHYGDLIDVLGHFAREVTPDGVAVSSNGLANYVSAWRNVRKPEFP